MKSLHSVRAFYRGIRNRFRDPISDWHIKPMSRYSRKICHLQWAVERTHVLDGDVVECGVGAGHSLMALALMTSHDRRNLIGVDTYAGFPSPSARDSPNFTVEKWEIYSRFDTSFVRKQAFRAGLSLSQIDSIILKPGNVSEVLSSSSAEISLLHLDLDLYQSYRDALHLTWDRLQSGAVVLFDEYDSPSDIKKWPGAKVAIDEFARDKSIEIERHWSGFCHLEKP